MTARDPKTGRFVATPKPELWEGQPGWYEGGGWYDGGGRLPRRQRRVWPRVLAVAVAALAVALIVWAVTR